MIGAFSPKNYAIRASYLKYLSKGSSLGPITPQRYRHAQGASSTFRVRAFARTVSADQDLKVYFHSPYRDDKRSAPTA